MTRAFVLGLVLGLVVLATACGGKSFESLCANQVPPPAACNTACDPVLGAQNNCPAGYHCGANGKCDTFCTPTGGECGDGYACTADGYCVSDGGCVGLECRIADCQAKGMSPTTISGTVFAPNGTLPLYGVSVYVPNKAPGPFAPSIQCGSCANALPGDPVAQALTDDKGNFTLTNVPDGANIPVVITIGKWRRQLRISNVAACETQALVAVDTTLPKSRDDMTPNTTSVDLPQIAISTGKADSLECLVRRLGIADKEITTDMQGGKIHLFADKSAAGVGVTSFKNGFGGGTGSFSDSQTLWGNVTNPGKLSNYDIVILSCEGEQDSNTKPQQAMDHLKAYADVGGRVFLSHWHNIWLEGSTQNPTNGAKPAVWTGIATFQAGSTDLPDGTVDKIDEVNNPKGMSFAQWMLNVGGSPSNMRDAVPIADKTGKQTATSLIKDAAGNYKAEQWVYLQNGQMTPPPQMFQFSTPNEMAPENRCGKVVFSDMHVSNTPNLNASYPDSCGTTNDLTPQEKALAFMFFDISSCVGVLF